MNALDRHLEFYTDWDRLLSWESFTTLPYPRLLTLVQNYIKVKFNMLTVPVWDWTDDKYLHFIECCIRHKYMQFVTAMSEHGQDDNFPTNWNIATREMPYNMPPLVSEQEEID